MSLEELVEISRYYGANPDYVVAGGGNTSCKEGDTLYIKGSGAALAAAAPDNFVKMDRRRLARIWEKDYPRNPDERESTVLADMMDARLPGEEEKRPSVETLLHDMLPFAYVVHTHPALVNGLTCSQEGEAAARELFGDDMIWIPSTNPGYILSLAVKNAMDQHSARQGRAAQIILLQNHGVFVGADSTEEIKALYRRIMETLSSKIDYKPDFSGMMINCGFSRELAAEIRRLASGDGASESGGEAAVLFRRDHEIEMCTADAEAFRPVSSAFTPDHIVYAGSDPLFVDSDGSSLNALLSDLRTAWKEHREGTGRMPKIAALKGMGIFGIGPTEKTAALAIELFMDTIKVAGYARAFGGGRFMARDQIDFINNWEVERYRTRVAVKGA